MPLQPPAPIVATSIAAMIAAALVVSATSCGTTKPVSATTAEPSPETTSQVSEDFSASSAPESGLSDGNSYTVTFSAIAGATPDGGGTWHAEVAQVSGGDPAVAAAFNKAGEASARQQIDRARVEADSIPSWTFEVKPTVTFRPTAIAQLLTGVYYVHGAAHPNNYVSTIVIDSRTAEPIMLKDLFVNEQDGLNRLSEQTKQIWPKVYGDGDGPMPDEPGNRAIAENFANWIPTADGMELHFADYQFGHGLPVITVPWSSLTDVLAPDMVALAER